MQWEYWMHSLFSKCPFSFSPWDSPGTIRTQRVSVGLVELWGPNGHRGSGVTGLQRCGQLEKYQKGPWCTEYREQPLLWAGMRASVSSCMWETNLQTTTVCKHYFITFLGVKILIEWYWEIIATHNLKNFLWGHVYQHRIPLKFIYFCDWFL